MLANVVYSESNFIEPFGFLVLLNAQLREKILVNGGQISESLARPEINVEIVDEPALVRLVIRILASKLAVLALFRKVIHLDLPE